MFDSLSLTIYILQFTTYGHSIKVHQTLHCFTSTAVKGKHWLFLNSQNFQIADSKNTIFEGLIKDLL